MRELQSSYWCGHQDMQILPVSTANKAETGKKTSKIWGQKGDMVEKQNKNQTTSHVIDEASVLVCV